MENRPNLRLECVGIVPSAYVHPLRQSADQMKMLHETMRTQDRNLLFHQDSRGPRRRFFPGVENPGSENSERRTTRVSCLSHVKDLIETPAPAPSNLEEGPETPTPVAPDEAVAETPVPQGQRTESPHLVAGVVAHVPL